MFFTTTKTEAKKSYDDLTQNSVSQENFFVAFSILSEDIFPIQLNENIKIKLESGNNSKEQHFCKYLYLKIQNHSTKHFSFRIGTFFNSLIAWEIVHVQYKHNQVFSIHYCKCFSHCLHKRLSRKCFEFCPSIYVVNYSGDFFRRFFLSKAKLRRSHLTFNHYFAPFCLLCFYKKCQTQNGAKAGYKTTQP